MYAHLIPPGAADTVHYRLKIPEDCGDSITLTAKLNYRKFSWWNTQWAFAGVRDPCRTRIPMSPRTTTTGAGYFKAASRMSPPIPGRFPTCRRWSWAKTPSRFRWWPKTAPPFAENLAFNPKDRERWNDYGIGLLLQGDLKGAERAFENVTKLDPQYADGWVNIARARIQEGNIDAAKPVLEKALAAESPPGKRPLFLAASRSRRTGNIPQAFDEFAKAAAQYPRDRVVRNQMGRMLFLQRKYRDAVAELEKTLAVDPEDLEAHYNLMLCYRGLNNDELATREEKLYLRFKADESSRAITGPFKLTHPDDNNEAQPVHEHVSVALRNDRRQ